MKGKTAFSVLQDNVTATEVALMSWCPNHMDLLAVVTKLKISVHRLSWQELFAVDIDADDEEAECDVSAIAWRPDGKMIALGRRDGTVELFSVESRERVYTANVLDGPITLEWVDTSKQLAAKVTSLAQADSDQISLQCNDRTGKFFSELPPFEEEVVEVGQIKTGPVFTDFFSLNRPATGCDADKQSNLNLLLVGDDQGNIAISAFGCWPIAHIKVGEPNVVLHVNPDQTPSSEPTESKARIVRLFMSDKLHFLSAIVRSDDQLEAWNFSCQIFQARFHEIKLICTHLQHVNYLFAYIHRAVQMCVASWTKLHTNIYRKFRAILDLLEDSGLTGTIESELVMLLLAGAPSAPMHKFLSEYLSLDMVARYMKSVNSGCTLMLKLLQLSLPQAAEELAFRLGELRALSRWKERYQVPSSTFPLFPHSSIGDWSLTR